MERDYTMKRVHYWARPLLAVSILVACAAVLTSATNAPFTVQSEGLFYVDPVHVNFCGPDW